MKDVAGLSIIKNKQQSSHYSSMEIPQEVIEETDIDRYDVYECAEKLLDRYEEFSEDGSVIRMFNCDVFIEIRRPTESEIEQFTNDIMKLE